MNARLLTALLAAAALTGCGFDSTPESSGSAPASRSAATSGANAADQDARKEQPEPGKTADGEKKAE